MTDDKEKFMKAALDEARKAVLSDEVPVGCVIVKDGKIIARGHNEREKHNDPTSHAEISAIRKACRKLKSWRLPGCDIYVTIEPCAMCAGTILWSRLRKVYFGSRDPKGGALGSSFDLYKVAGLNHYPEVEGGLLASDCEAVMKNYFKAKRNGKI